MENLMLELIAQRLRRRCPRCEIEVADVQEPWFVLGESLNRFVYLDKQLVGAMGVGIYDEVSLMFIFPYDAKVRSDNWESAVDEAAELMKAYEVAKMAERKLWGIAVYHYQELRGKPRPIYYPPDSPTPPSKRTEKVFHLNRVESPHGKRARILVKGGSAPVVVFWHGETSLSMPPQRLAEILDDERQTQRLKQSLKLLIS